MRPGGEVRVSVDVARCFCTDALRRVGLSSENAEVVAECLIEADLRGIIHHGLARMPNYVRRFQRGGFNTQPDIRVLQDMPAAALLDGDRAPGELAGTRTMAAAIAKARTQGVGIALVRNSGAFGSLGYFPIMALREDMIGIATVSTIPILASPGASQPTIGNSPLAIGIPAGKERPILFDMALSVVSIGKIRAARAEGEKIPLGWAVDKDGQPTDDPAAAIEGLLLPVAGYKGFGLAVALGCITGVLSGGHFGTDVRGTLDPANPADVSLFCIAVNIASFMPIEEFKARTDDLVRQQQSAPLFPGGSPARMPGEGSWQTKDERLQNGIPYGPALLAELRELARDLGIGGLDR